MYIYSYKSDLDNKFKYKINIKIERYGFKVFLVIITSRHQIIRFMFRFDGFFSLKAEKRKETTISPQLI